jgi:hypothetical protein
MTKQQLIARHNWQIKHKSLMPLLIILFVEVLIVLHQTGILIMTR